MEFKDKIELLEPKTMKEAIKKLWHYYEQAQHKLDTISNWQAKGNIWNKGNWPKRGLERKEGKRLAQKK